MLAVKHIGPVDLFKTFLLVKLRTVGTVHSGLGHGRSFHGFIFAVVAGLKYRQASLFVFSTRNVLTVRTL